MRDFLMAAAVVAMATPVAADGFVPVQMLPDLSGITCLFGDNFLLVHDAKMPDEPDRVRVSLLKSPRSPGGLMWKPLFPDFPGGASSDLESAARIPGSPFVLLAESADDHGPYRRIFLAHPDGDDVTIIGETGWDEVTDAYNIEASAVARAGDGWLFLWAERNSGRQDTALNWAPLTLEPFGIGPAAGSAPFALPADWVGDDGKPLYSRPLVGLDVAPDGQIYAAAAFDPEGSAINPDNGPYRSAVMKIGTVDADGVKLDPQPVRIATLDGFKTESVTVCSTESGTRIYVGTDDENYGGTLRQLPAFP